MQKTEQKEVSLDDLTPFERRTMVRRARGAEAPAGAREVGVCSVRRER